MSQPISLSNVPTTSRVTFINIPYTWFCIVEMSSILLGIFVSLFWALCFHFSHVTTTHCGAYNWFPSFSSVIGNLWPEIYIWRMGILGLLPCRIAEIVTLYWFLARSHIFRDYKQFIGLYDNIQDDHTTDMNDISVQGDIEEVFDDYSTPNSPPTLAPPTETSVCSVWGKQHFLSILPLCCRPNQQLYQISSLSSPFSSSGHNVVSGDSSTFHSSPLYTAMTQYNIPDDEDIDDFHDPISDCEAAMTIETSSDDVSLTTSSMNVIAVPSPSNIHSPHNDHFHDKSSQITSVSAHNPTLPSPHPKSHHKQNQSSFMHFLVLLHSITMSVEYFGLTLLSFVSSTEFFLMHENGFIIFLIAAQLHTWIHFILTWHLWFVPHRFVYRLQCIKTLLYLIHLASLYGIYHFYSLHTSTCRDSLYSYFGICEYVLVLTNTFFHLLKSLQFSYYASFSFALVVPDFTMVE